LIVLILANESKEKKREKGSHDPQPQRRLPESHRGARCLQSVERREKTLNKNCPARKKKKKSRSECPKKKGETAPFISGGESLPVTTNLKRGGPSQTEERRNGPVEEKIKRQEIAPENLCARGILRKGKGKRKNVAEEASKGKPGATIGTGKREECYVLSTYATKKRNLLNRRSPIKETPRQREKKKRKNIDFLPTLKEKRKESPGWEAQSRPSLSQSPDQE